MLKYFVFVAQRFVGAPLRFVQRSCFVQLAVFVFVFVFVAEGISRFVFGFGNAPLFQSDSAYEYIAQPNQDRFRFLCHYKTNSYSQRSEEPDSTKKRILGLGDSVLYGGTWMDQDSLATTLFSKETCIQMLNISCGSWGPDNCAAYLKKHGTFGASAMFLVCSSHDAYDVMSFAPVVGVVDKYPNKQYVSGLWELIDRYLIPYFRTLTLTGTGNKTKTITKTKTNRGGYVDPDVQVEKKAANRQVVQKGYLFNPGFDQLKHIADSCQIPMVIYLHAELGEVQDGGYNDMGQDIIHWCDTAGVRLIRGVNTETPDMYHDAIHFNEKGQRHLADVMKMNLI